MLHEQFTSEQRRQAVASFNNGRQRIIVCSSNFLASQSVLQSLLGTGGIHDRVGVVINFDAPIDGPRYLQHIAALRHSSHGSTPSKPLIITFNGKWAPLPQLPSCSS